MIIEKIALNLSFFPAHPIHSQINPKIKDDTHFIYPMGFFDGDAQGNTCACGFLIVINADLTYRMLWNCGVGSNTKAEAVALWGLLWFNSFLGNPILHIYGDSKIIIDHVLQKAFINNTRLQGWIERIEHMWNLQDRDTIQHIRGSLNKEENSVSKKGACRSALTYGS